MIQDCKRRIAKDKAIITKTINECLKRNVDEAKVKKLCETYIDLLVNQYPTEISDEVRIIFEKHAQRLLKRGVI
jgi:hypothetical protein